MKQSEQIPYYASDGASLGFRSAENARRLVDGGFVEPSYGRKGHLKAIWARRQDGTNPIEAHAPTGTRYSLPEKLESGHRCWKLRRLDRRDDDGTLVSTRGIFLQVITDCMIP
jgi:hypothetical protein